MRIVGRKNRRRPALIGRVGVVILTGSTATATGQYHCAEVLRAVCPKRIFFASSLMVVLVLTAAPFS